MHRRTLLAALGAAALLPTAAAAETLYVAESNDGYLNLRSGPGTGHPVVARLTAGTEVSGLARQGNWRQLALPDGTLGWAHLDWLSTVFRQRRPYDYRVVRTNDGYLNLRSGPGTNYRILRRLWAGQRLFALDWSGTWVLVQLPEGTRGWVSSRYLAPA